MVRYGERRIAREKKEKPTVKLRRGRIDYIFLLLVLIILTVGLISLFSASHANAYHLYKQDSYYFISKQLTFAVAGLFIMALTASINYKIYEKIAWPMIIVTVVLLVIVLFNDPYNDSRRWINIADIFTFQPSEIAKFTVVILFAHLVNINKDRMNTFRYGILPFLPIGGIIAFLIYKEPHLSGTLLVVSIVGIMLLVGGAKISHLAILAVLGGLVAFYVIRSGSVGYASNRIAVWQDPWIDPKVGGYQNIQSLLAIGSGGTMGVGIGNSSQKHLYLPEPQNDFIFAIVCEEVGFIGATIIVLLFAALVWRGFVIAARCNNKFGKMIATGLTAQLAVQTILNVMVVTKLFPNTGISLPFFSAGGTSLIMLLAQMGVILSISRRHPENVNAKNIEIEDNNEVEGVI